ncbi:hypothetical protein [Phaeobacter sp. B1627]|uniref:hypothetical protein n=1 Tax=Phaeobacter sp. B1627 TaxID=2583809 RepID=UPI0021085A4B|nr:hypothetical protein [Phaeobacter sp. B1627]
MPHTRSRRRLRTTVLGLATAAGVLLSACSLDQEEEVRSNVQSWVKLGETFYFFSRVNCTAALFDVKANRISSLIRKAGSIEAGMRAIVEGETVAFQIDALSPTQVTEQIMTLDLPLGLGVLSSGTGGKDCMAEEMEVAYFNALLDPTSVLIYAPQDRSMAVFDRRNRRLFFSRGRPS